MPKEDERRANARLALINVGSDATLEDCQFFNSHNFADAVPFDTKDLEAVRKKLTAIQVMDTKADREESLLRQLGKNLIAKSLLENKEGRLAIRDEMNRLEIDGLRDLLGFDSPTGLME